MIINHNMSAMNANRNVNINSTSASKSMQKLSSGLRINNAADDAAGLAISEKMRGQIRGLDQGAKNAQDGISLIQTAEGALNETTSILQRMRELSVQSATATNTTADRSAISTEFTQMQKEITRIGTQTEFNTKALIGGAFSAKSLDFQIGANADQTISLNIKNMTATGLSVDTAKASVNTATAAQLATASLDNALKAVSSERANLGSVQNRLEHTINNLNTSSENLQTSESRIRDVDMAKEMSEFSKNNILSQAAQAMLSQANQQPQQILQLLR
ncbi:flagellin N-terminal helical domain-containing protein [Clostridium estertheticum]|uniref:Flagellin n=1 Tax=Clostridium estertheticum subsp. estertheticum TaxID=1552 RepID=A0A1J0GIM5_9CLOT|nr:flagellin [Clostridium estertheticum]APC41171.1 flagellin [Clostridium estertheticum subsp. estertheticum]MBU3074182.1 flagellin [Clostridium estertheticum]MBU3164276.1 flagellin [Clostridium estertheticum]